MKSILLFVSFIVMTFASFAQADLEKLVKPGTKLVYGVESQGKKYDFIVTVKKLIPAVSFGWEMTDPINTSGTIVHTKKAMASANTMFNYFQPGKKQLDDETACVWLSQSAFAGLNKSGDGIPFKMNVGETAKNMGTFTKNTDLDILVDGKKEKVAESMAKEINDGSPMGDNYFTFSTTAKVPIILRMQNGFYIVLKEIRTK